MIIFDTIAKKTNGRGVSVLKKYMLGVDIGTTNVKAALFTYSGEEIFVKSASYNLFTDEEGAATQSAEEIKEQVFKVLKESANEANEKEFEISFVSFSAAMHSLLAVDEKGEAILPVYTWGDRQAEAFVQELENEVGTDLYHRTGTPIHVMNPLVKMIWLKNEQPKIIEKAHKFLGIKSFVLYHLFGEYYTDYSIGNATGMFNMHDLSWDKEALEIAGISENKLSKLVPTTEVLHGMKEEIASELGLPIDIPVVIGASDGCLANLGVNAFEPGKVALTIGTSGAIRSVTDKPKTDKNQRTFCYALTEDHWVVGGPVNNGGVVLDWARQRFTNTGLVEFEEMMDVIETVNPGADGLFFHPYLLGERSPIWRSDAKGSFFGLDLHHRNDHMLRSVLEGINMNLYAVYKVISEVIGADAKEFLVTGGFIKSKAWLQLISDIFGIDFVVTSVTENGCFGATILGLLALGEIKDFREVSEMIPIVERIQPNQEQHTFYKAHFKKYQIINKHLITMLDEI